VQFGERRHGRVVGHQTDINFHTLQFPRCEQGLLERQEALM